MRKKAIIALLVENNANVLSRVTMLFGRRGYNIDSLTVSETNDPHISRITMTTTGDDRIIEQIILQTKKLVDVKAVQIEDEQAILRELLLVKIRIDENKRQGIREICEVYKASIVDFSPSSMVFELTGRPSKVNGFLDVISTEYEILELCRTGVTAMDHGDSILKCKDNVSHMC